MTDQEVLEITQQISFLIEETGRQQDNRSRCRAAHIECRELGWILAIEFGRRYGWKLIDGVFTITALRDRKVHSSCRKYDPLECFSHPYVDHGFFFRWPDNRAAAIASHLYSTPEDIETWASKNGLQVSFPTDFPSWHYPGRTTLVLIQRAKEAHSG